ncbi:DegT/DnrJ/EryC1/StrS aminotransferase family protein [Methanobrevibacter sp.]|uniref:DegT/DnrJ/EryC1/StrS family aminotransferase n=1 Tax=Methanobrevibacter sp. TaxID=66852 RepID=UPI0025D6B953|nr:DegT/DnrJ/EryC1/StrS family aminotransferase [Methanobrevibacter sp.]MBQ2831603.1 DegT/DnrJ/EryC1/StrS family aminotransferase [Methanobrevibacter sp.]
MMINYVLAKDTWEQEEFDAIMRVIESNRFTMGPEVESFEKEFAEYFGSKHAIMVNSGSSANLIAIASLILSDKYNLNPGDEVIVPAVSWATTYSVLYQHGIKLKFVDIDLDTFNLDLNEVEKAITENTRAIFAVNLLGNPNNFDKLLDICENNDLILIEDNCESMGAKFKGKYTGTFGILGTFSTFYSHHMATMEGGMVLTDDDELNDIMKSIRSHGWTRNLSKNSKFISEKDEFYNLFNFIFPGYNVRPIEMEAAIGREQLKKLDKFLENRKDNGEYFTNLFSQLDNVKIQKNQDDSSYFGFPLIFESKSKREEVIKLFEKENIECRPIVAGNFTRNKVIDYFDYEICGILKNSDILHNQGLFIGNHHIDSKNDIKKIFEILNNI